MAFHQHFPVIGYHSCEREVGLRLVSGNDHLKPSNNPWDWLGPGIYFWEDNPYRALGYAVDCAQKKQKFSGNIKNPLAVGALIDMGYCLNLIEPNAINIIREAYEVLKSKMKLAGQPLPRNNGADRRLDCAVIKYMHELNKMNNRRPYDTIRCPFNEGKPIYEGANFTAGLHIQVCVINPDQIKGYFLPRPVEKFNPWLHKDFKTSAQ